MKIDTLVKYFFYLVLTITIIIGFVSYIENIIFENIVYKRVDYIESKVWLDLFIILSLLLYFSIKVKECETSQANKSVIFFLVIWTSYYTYERFFNNFFIFLPFSISDSTNSNLKFRYLDTIYVILIIELFPLIKDLFPIRVNSFNNTLLDDAPIKDKSEDLLEGLLNVPADKIIKAIKDNQFDSSFTIGLNAEWGDGKSSIFNLVKNEIKEQCIIVDFNPWIGYDKKVLVRDFFNSISESLGLSLSQNFSNYSDEILNNGDSTIFKAIKSIVYGEKSIESIFESLNEKIGKLNKKIVVFIDDVDRLDNEEIFELFKLIRKTANFQNFFFIVAYDRNYVSKVLDKYSGESAIKYLDKIINTELNLPYYDKNILKKYFIESLKKLISIEFHNKIDYFTKSYEKDSFNLDLGFSENDLFIYWLNNFREIKKIINSIVINYGDILKQINLVDVIYLEILKLKHPKLYSVLITKQTEIFSINQNSYTYVLAPLDSVKASNARVAEFIENRKQAVSNTTLNQEKEKLPTVFEYYLDEYAVQYSVNKIEKERIKDLISRIFLRFDDNSFNLMSTDDDYSLSVRFVNKFERYFSHVVFKNNITEDEFEYFLNLDKSEIPLALQSFILNGKLNDLTYRLNQKFNFKNRKEYENTIIASFWLLELPNNTIKNYQLISKMFGRKMFPNIFSDHYEAKEFFNEVFTKANSSLNEYARILIELRKRNRRRNDGDDERFPLSDIEIESILESYIIKQIDSGELFNISFWNLYFICQKMDEYGTLKPFEKVNKLILEKIKNKDTELKLLKSMIIYSGYDNFSTLRKGAIENLFEGFENFESEFLNKLEETDYIREFKDYFSKSKEANWEEIEYNYEFLKESIPNDSPYFHIVNQD